MTRSVSSPTSTAAAGPVTQPGYLVQIGFTSYTYRFSSRDDITWNSLSWVSNNLQVGALSEAPNGGAALSVVIGNADRAFGAACLIEAPQEKPVSVWAFYEGAIATGDPVLIFSGVVDGPVDITEQSVTLPLSSLNTATLFIPRVRVTPAAGFNRLSPAGRVIQFGNIRYELTSAT